MNHCSCTVQARGCPQACEWPKEPAAPPQTTAQTTLGTGLPSAWRGCHARVSRLRGRTEKNPTGQEFSQEMGLTCPDAITSPDPALAAPELASVSHGTVQVQSTINPIQTDAD